MVKEVKEDGRGSDSKQVRNRGNEVPFRYVGEQWDMWAMADHHGVGSILWDCFVESPRYPSTHGPECWGAHIFVRIHNDDGDSKAVSDGESKNRKEA